MNIFIYSRKSKFTGKGESIENQITLCRDYILSRIPGAREDEIIPFEDEGFSGKNTARPQFQRMMELVRTTQVDYIVCYKLDRITRSVGDFSGLIEELGERNVSFVCIKEQFDTSTPMGRAMMYMASVFAQLERETIAERIRDNMYQLAKSGRWLGGTTPTGFRSEPTQQSEPNGKIRTSYLLMPIPEELALVQLVFDTFLKTESVAGTARSLNVRQYRTKNGGEFGAESIKSILRNPVYAAADEASQRYLLCRGTQLCFPDADCGSTRGYLPFNRSCQGQHGRIPKEAADWIIAAGKHEGIIPGRDWVKAQTLLDEKRRRAKSSTPAPISAALLSGVLRCGGCGGRMRPRIFSGYLKADGKPAFYYACAAKDGPKNNTCTMNNANGYALEQAVCAELFAVPLSPASLLSRLEQLKAALGKTKASAGQQTALCAGMRETERKIQNLVTSIAAGENDPAVLTRIKGEIGALQTKQKADSRELATLMQAETGEAASHTRLERLASTLLPRALLGTTTPAEKKRGIASLATRIVWHGEAAHIYV